MIICAYVEAWLLIVNKWRKEYVSMSGICLTVLKRDKCQVLNKRLCCRLTFVRNGRKLHTLLIIFFPLLLNMLLIIFYFFFIFYFVSFSCISLQIKYIHVVYIYFFFINQLLNSDYYLLCFKNCYILKMLETKWKTIASYFKDQTY